MAVTRRRPGLLTGWAGAAPVPAHVAVGLGGDRVLAQLRATPRVDVVASPRHADVLVVAGPIPEPAHATLRAVHDQVPAPRATVVVDAGPAEVGLPHASSVGRDDVVGALVDLHGQVLAGSRADPTLGPPTNPVSWEGVGPHGQGGEGMMGGVPWGRPMAMPPVEGRDGLALDRLSLRLGPFLAGLAPLVVLDAGLQGDVLEEAALERLGPTPGRPGTATDVDESMLALVELAVLCGLPALAERAARLALDARPDEVAGLRRRLDHPLGLRPATDGVGRLDLPGLSGDVTDRWRRWLDRAATAAAGGAAPPTASVDLAALSSRLVGMELGHALLTLASVRPELGSTRVPAAVVP